MSDPFGPFLPAARVEAPEDPEQVARVEMFERLRREGKDTDGVDLDWRIKTPFIRYDRTTGEITGSGNTSMGGLRTRQADEPEAGFLPKEGHWDTHYVNVKTKRVRIRSDSPARLNGMVLKNLPSPCRIEISERASGTQTYDETDTTVELQFDHPGTYRIRILAVPHTPAEFTVTVDG